MISLEEKTRLACLFAYLETPRRGLRSDLMIKTVQSMDKSRSDNRLKDCDDKEDHVATVKGSAAAWIGKTPPLSVGGQGHKSTFNKTPMKTKLLNEFIEIYKEVVKDSQRRYKPLQEELKRTERRVGGQKRSRDDEDTSRLESRALAVMGAAHEPISRAQKRPCLPRTTPEDTAATNEDGQVYNPATFFVNEDKINTPLRLRAPSTALLEGSEQEGQPSSSEYIFDEESYDDPYKSPFNQEYLDYVLQCGLNPCDTIRLVK